MKSIEENKKEFIEICSVIKRPGIEKFMNFLESSDFYIAPASSRFHGSYKGGLLQHSLNVYHELRRLLTAYPEISVSDETVAISGLFHDVCKVNFYEPEKRNRKNAEGKWESYDSYKINEKFCFGGHGGKSVFIIQSYMRLTAEEAVAINCHMSAFSDNKDYVGKSFEQFPFAWLLSVADQSATYIVEGE
ncbi:MAG: HD domain-containing protein [Parabacteroides sp.]|nr:HD domain-containing protein [Parabacteroides sp.]